MLISPDGRLLATRDTLGVVTFWDLASGEPLRQLGPFSPAGSPIPQGASAMAFSPDGKLFAVGAVDNTVRVWDTTTMLETHLFLGHILTITKVVFSRRRQKPLLRLPRWDGADVGPGRMIRG